MANRDEREEAEEEIQSKKKCSWLYSGVFLQAFALNFFAEWGDTSQITTILLAGNYPLLSGKGFDYPHQVLIGSSIGNFLCSLLAIVGGSKLKDCMKTNVISLIGGAVFLLFALHTTLFEIPNA